MKWGEGFKIHNWDDAWKAVLTIAIVITIFFMLIDFISWKTALDIIKKELPTNWQAIPNLQFIKGLGYVPLVWRGDVRYTGIETQGKPDDIGKILFLYLQIGNHKSVPISIDGNWGFYHDWKHDDEGYSDYDKQEFKDIEVFVKVTPIRYYFTDHYYCDAKIFVFGITEERTYVREVKTTLLYKCSGYWIGGK